MEVPTVLTRSGSVTVMRVERRVVVLRWDDPSGADTYNVYCDNVLVAEVDRLWAVDSAFADASVAIPEADPLEPGVSYRYRVETSSGEIVGSVDVVTVPSL